MIAAMCSECSNPRFLRTPQWATSESKVPCWEHRACRAAGQSRGKQGSLWPLREGLGTSCHSHQNGSFTVQAQPWFHTSAKGRAFPVAPVLKRRDPPGGGEEFLDYSETNLERDAEQTSQDFLVENTLNK